MKTHNTMKKSLIMLIMAMLMTVGPAMAQVFMMEDDDAMNVRDGEGIVFNVIVPSQDSGSEQFLPLGGGTALLIGLGAA